MPTNRTSILIEPPFCAEFSPATGELRIGGTVFPSNADAMKVELVVGPEALREYRDHLRALLRALETVEMPANTTPRRQ